MDFHTFGWGQPVGVFGFVILIVLIGSLFSWLKTRAQQETIREAIRKGIDLDPQMLNKLDNPSDGKGSLLLAGMILLAASVALVFFGYQIGQVEPDDEVFTIFLGIAGFPFMIGIVLLLVGLFRRKDTAE